MTPFLGPHEQAECRTGLLMTPFLGPPADRLSAPKAPRWWLAGQVRAYGWLAVPTGSVSGLPSFVRSWLPSSKLLGPVFR